jgi:methionyl-tRNA formyltransferase
MRRVLLIGEGPTAASALDSLLPGFDVVGLVRSTPGAATEIARRHRVRVFDDASLAAVDAAVRRLAPDCVVVSSYDRILPPRLLARCRFINVHYAPLPEGRGRATVNWAIINRRPYTAITLHVLVAELDAGPIIFQQLVAIRPHDTVTDLYSRLNQLQRLLLGPAVERHLDGDPGVAQNDTAATYACTRVPADGEIDWERPTADVYALVRALADPFPGAFTYLDARPLRVWRAAPCPDTRRWTGRVPGRVVGRSEAEGWVDVLTGDGALRLHIVQREGAPQTHAAEVIGSVRSTLGLRTADLLDRLRALEQHVPARARNHRMKAAR